MSSSTALRICAAALAPLALISVCVSAAFLHNHTRGASSAPDAHVVDLSWFSQLWIALFSAVYSFDALWLTLHPSTYPQARVRACMRVCTCIAACASICVSICYGVGLRPEVAATSAVLAAFLLLSVYARVREQRHAASATPSLNAPFLSVDHNDGLPYTRMEGGTAAGAADWLGTDTPKPSKRTCVCTLGCTARGVWCAVICLCTLLHALTVGGAATQARGYTMYPPRGQFYRVQVGDQYTRTHAWCTPPGGPSAATDTLTPASNATVWFEIGGGGHSMSDTWGLQFALNAAGYRVCTFDPPGTGWSEPVNPALLNVPAHAFTYALMAAMGEPGPFIMLGTMDDGPERIYDFALAYPSLVQALIPMQWTESEFITYARWKGQSFDAATPYAKATIASRLMLGDIIRGVAVQWGVMSLLLPRSTYQPAHLAAESSFLNVLNEKQWSMQCLYLADQVANPSTLFQRDLWYTNHSLSPSIPVFMFHGNQTIQPGDCDGADACGLLQFTMDTAYAYSVMMASITNGSRLYVCTNCTDWMGTGANIPWVAERIVDALSTLPPVAAYR